MMAEMNPCDVCKSKVCKTGLERCALDVYARKNVCYNYECFCQYDTACMLGLYEYCGAWED